MNVDWKIEWSREAFSDLNKLERKDTIRIIKKLELAASNPFHYFDRLVGSGDYKLRVGDYRIIALLIHERHLIFIEKLGHRKNIYEK